MSKRRQSCVICGAPAGGAYRQFCSRRCADVDLARWFGGTYRVETEEPAEDNDGPAEGADD